MQEASRFDSGQMPAVESVIASLIVPPDEALGLSACCTPLRCCISDDMLYRVNDSGVCTGLTRNSLSHLMLALSSSESFPNDHYPGSGLCVSAGLCSYDE